MTHHSPPALRARYLSGWRLRMRQRPLEEAGVVAALERARRLVGEGEGLELLRAVDEGARDQLAVDLVQAEHRERVAMRGRDDRLDRAGVERRRPRAPCGA